MKKMSSFTENKPDVMFFGQSNQKGIFMRIDKLLRFELMSTTGCFHFPGAYACITKDGSIKVNPDETQEILNEIKEKDIQERKNYEKIGFIFFIFWIISFSGIFWGGFIHPYLTYIFSSLMLLSFGLYRTPGIVYAIYKKIIRDKEYIQKLKFHSAEHAAINAYYDLNRAPTIEEIKKYSNYSYNCGTLKATQKVFPFILMAIARLVPNVWFFLIATFVIITMTSVLYKKKLLFFTECLFLSKPTEFEYDVAIQAMNAALQINEVFEEETKEIINEIPEIHAKFDGNDGEIIIQIGVPDYLEDE